GLSVLLERDTLTDDKRRSSVLPLVRPGRRDSGSQAGGLRHALLCVPVAQAHFDAGAGERFGEYSEIAAPVVIRIDNRRMESAHRVGRFLRKHRVRLVHANEGYVDMLERAHLGYTLGVGAEVETLAAVSDHISVVAALRMEILT